MSIRTISPTRIARPKRRRQQPKPTRHSYTVGISRDGHQSELRCRHCRWSFSTTLNHPIGCERDLPEHHLPASRFSRRLAVLELFKAVS